MYNIYSIEHCRFCEELFDLLDLHGIPFKEIKVSKDYWKALGDQTNNKKTFPIVFHNNTFVGGYTEMVNIFIDL